MIDVLDDERADLKARLKCDVVTDPTKTVPVLAANQPVALLLDPEITPVSSTHSEYRFEVWLIHPSTDEHAARQWFSTQLGELREMPFERAQAELFTPPTGRAFFSYRVTYIETYQE